MRTSQTALKKQGVSRKSLEAVVLKKVRETSKSCKCESKCPKIDGNDEERSRNFGIELLATRTNSKSDEDASKIMRAFQGSQGTGEHGHLILGGKRYLKKPFREQGNC